MEVPLYEVRRLLASHVPLSRRNSPEAYEEKTLRRAPDSIRKN